MVHSSPLRVFLTSRLLLISVTLVDSHDALVELLSEKMPHIANMTKDVSISIGARHSSDG